MCTSLGRNVVVTATKKKLHIGILIWRSPPGFKKIYHRCGLRERLRFHTRRGVATQ